jgi:OOP family OmpA-OmpF porin
MRQIIPVPCKTKTPFLLLKLSFFSFLFLAAEQTVSAQDKVKDPNDQKARVNVLVTDKQERPRKGDQVLFIGEKKKQVISVKTDATGKATVSLSPGDTYLIKLKSLNDTTDYSSIEVPALQPGQYFTSAFSVDIQYEPARTFTLNNVHFDTGKPTLRPDSFKELNEIAAYMNSKDGEHYEIAGHTDNVGKEEDNNRLSQQRAEAVKNYLAKKGVDTARLTAKGYGSSKPVADNETNEGKQKNRRTEVIIL